MESYEWLLKFFVGVMNQIFFNKKTIFSFQFLSFSSSNQIILTKTILIYWAHEPIQSNCLKLFISITSTQ